MAFRKSKSFGPRIYLTDKQIARAKQIAADAGLHAVVENCSTGSAYVAIHETEVRINIAGEAYVGTGEEIAKIRLSGHDEGRRQDSTHSVVGTKSRCLGRLWEWLQEIIQEQQKQ